MHYIKKKASSTSTITATATTTTPTSWISTSLSVYEMTADKRRLTGVTCASPIPLNSFNGSRKFLFAVALCVLLASVNCAADQKTIKPSPASPLLSSASASNSGTTKDEIYIDDESIEGSGGRSGLHDDLEKDPDYSGSGFGPDDEDSSTDLQESHRGINSQTHSGKHNTNIVNNNNNNNDDNDDLITSRTYHQTNSGTIIGSKSGSNSGIIGGNSGSNTGLNTIAKTIATTTTDTKHQTLPSIPTNQNTFNTSITSTNSATTNKNRDSLFNPNQVEQTHLPAVPQYPAGGKKHSDDDDFDLGDFDDDYNKKNQLIGGANEHDDDVITGSGDDGYIDGHTEEDDDDHTGDVDDEDLIERPHQRQHELGSNKPTTNIDSSTTSTSTSSTSSSSSSSSSIPVTDTTSKGSDANDRKKIVNANSNVYDHEDHEDHNENEDEDDFEDDYEDGKDGDDDDTDDDTDDDDDNDHDSHEEDENTEVYIDSSEPKSKGGNSGSSQDNERGNANQGNTIHELGTNNVNSQPTDTKVIDHTTGNEVLIMNTSDEDRTASFFAQPGILAAVIGGAVVGLLCAILVVMFIVYRMRKKDEGSYALDEPKRSPAVNSYAKNANNREFFA